MLQWNIRGLNGNLHLLLPYIQQYQPVIICLQEAMCAPGRYPTIQNYQMITRDKGPNGKQGLVTAIRNDIPFQINSGLSLGIPLHHIIDVTITINTEQFRIINFYRSHNTADKVNLTTIPQYNDGKNFIICADLNAHHSLWGSARNDAHGISVTAQLDDIGCLSTLNDKSHTYEDRHGKSAIDVTFASNNIANRLQWQTLPTLLSDHLGINITLNSSNPATITTQPLRWTLNHANWPLINNHLDSLLEINPPQTNAQDEDTLLLKLLQESLNNSIKHKHPRDNKPKLYKAKWQTDPVYKIVKNTLNYRAKKYRRNPSADNLTLLRQAQTAVKQTGKQAKHDSWLNFCANIDNHTSTSQIWKKLKTIEKRRPSTPLHPNPTVEAERLIKHFISRSKSTNLPDCVLSEINSTLEERKRNIKTHTDTPDPDTDQPFTFIEFTRAINHSKNTSPGDDNIPNALFCHISTNFKLRLFSLFNMSWQTSILPKRWKHAIIVPIPKPGQPKTPRPISLLCTVDKLMERMVLPRLQYKYGPLHPNIRAFCTERGTDDCLNTLLTLLNIKLPRTKKRLPMAIFLDLEKAFELANDSIILDLLASRGINGKMLAWITSYLDKRTAQVRFQGKLSTTHCFENGTPQGAILSPFLFNVIMEHIVSIKTFTQYTTVMSYADDIVLINNRPDNETVPKDLKLIENSCARLGMKIAPAKSLAVTFRTTKIKNQFELTMQTTPIKWGRNYQYLGVKFDSHLTFTSHTEYLCKRVQSRLSMMKYMSGTKAGASASVLRTFYLAAIRSILEYGAQCLLLSKPSNLKRLDRLQNVALRRITRAPPWTQITTMQHATNIQPLVIRRRSQVLKQTDKILRSSIHPKYTEPEELYMHPIYKQYKNALDPNEISLDDNVWINLVKTAWIHSELTLPPTHPAIYLPPWQNINTTFITELPTLRKQDCNHHDLLADTLIKIDPFLSEDNIVMYTDGSVHPTNHTGGAAIHCRHQQKQTNTSYRTLDHASSLQTELIAINQALVLAAELSSTAKLVILTDSLGSIQTLQHTQPPDNRALIHSIIHALTIRSARTTIIWVPSHVGVPGNEEADKLAGLALKLTAPTIDLPKLSISQQKANIAKYTHAFLDNYYYYNEAKSTTFHNYAERTALMPIKIPPNKRFNETLIYYFFLTYENSAQYTNRDRTCPYCPATYSLKHLLFQCPATKNHPFTAHLPSTLSDDNKFRELTKKCIKQPNTILAFFKDHKPPL